MEPNWASPGAATSGAPAGGVDIPSVNTGAANAVQRKDRSNCYQALVSLVLVGLCGSMITLGVFVIIRNRAINDFQEWFIATYMILFSVLLFLYEAMWWCTVGSLNRVLRKNFGFMYKIYGKALYLVLVASLCIGISSQVLQDLDWLRWFTGIAWGGVGILMIVLQFTAPHIFGNYTGPTGGIIETFGTANDVTV